MKTIRTISIDPEVWIKARAKYTNLSLHIQELLHADLLNKQEDEQTPEELKKLVTGHEQTIAVLNAKIEKQCKKEEEANVLPFDLRKKVERGDFEI